MHRCIRCIHFDYTFRGRITPANNDYMENTCARLSCTVNYVWSLLSLSLDQPFAVQHNSNSNIVSRNYHHHNARDRRAAVNMPRQRRRRRRRWPIAHANIYTHCCNGSQRPSKRFRNVIAVCAGSSLVDEPCAHEDSRSFSRSFPIRLLQRITGKGQFHTWFAAFASD